MFERLMCDNSWKLSSGMTGVHIEDVWITMHGLGCMFKCKTEVS